MKLPYNQSMSSKKVEVCDKKLFEAFLESKTLKENLSVYRKFLADMDAEKDPVKSAVLEDSKKELKATLFPLFLPQCSEFRNNLRCKENAVEGCFVTGDYDHCGIDLAAYISELKERVDFKKEGVVFAEVSVGGDGLHVWALAREGETVLDAQMRLETLVGLKRDTAMNRIYQGSLLSGEVLYYDEELMWSDEGKVTFVNDRCADEPVALDSAVQCGSSCVSSAGANAERCGDELFRGVPIYLIVEHLVNDSGGAIGVGERHTRLCGLAYLLRNICDYNPERLFGVLSLACDYDDRNDLMRICSDACKYASHKKMPYRLTVAIEKARAEHQAENFTDETHGFVTVPKHLPSVFKTFISKCPTEYAPAMLMVLLTLFGFLATKVRCLYNQATEEHPLTFMTFVSASFAGGKSFVRYVVDVVLKNVKEETKRLLKLENEWKRKSLLKQKKGKGEPEPAPKFPIRYISSQLSNTEFLNRLSNADGEHLFFFEEEFGSLIKSSRRGPAYEFWDVYRLAFDGAENKQNFYSPDSLSGIENAMLNFVVCGTPKLLGRELNKHVEDGLASRLLIATIPQDLGAEQPVFKKLNETELAELETVCDMLSGLDETVVLKKVERALRGWMARQRKVAEHTYSASRFLLMRRAAVMGYRAGVIAYLLSSRKESKHVSDFAVWVAEYVYLQQLDMFGKSVDEIFGEDDTVVNKPFDYYEALPECFEARDLRELRVRNNASANISRILQMWKKNGIIEETDKKKTYRKILS